MFPTLCPKNTWIQVLNAQHKGVCAYTYTCIKKQTNKQTNYLYYYPVRIIFGPLFLPILCSNELD